MEEEWKPIDGFDGYFISNFGNVLSKKLKSPRLLKKEEDVNGYYIYTLYKNKGRCKKRAHRLVAKHFIEIPEWLNLNDAIVNHKDGNKKNNLVENLEWTDSFGNARHAWETGLISVEIITDSRKHLLKPIYKINRFNNKILKEYKSNREASAIEGLNSRNLSRAAKMGYKCGDYVWVYKEDYDDKRDYRLTNRKFLAYNRKHEMFIFFNMKHFADTHGLSSSLISKCIKEPLVYKSHKGWKFREISK